MSNFTFCGDPLWYVTEVDGGAWSGGPPLTWCFQHAVLALIPVGFYVLFLPVLFLQIRLSIEPPLPEDWLTSVKSGLSVLLLADKGVVLIRALWEKTTGQWDVLPMVEYVYPAANVLVLLHLLFMKKRCLNGGISSSGVIFCTWMAFVICGAPEFYVWLTLGTDPATVKMVNTYHYIAYLCWYPLICLQFLLHCFTIQHPPPGVKNPSPESQASFLSKQFFCWFSPIVRIGKSAPLVVNHLFALETDLQCRYLAEQWKKIWERRIGEYTDKCESARAYDAYTSLHTVTEHTPLIREAPTPLMKYGSNGHCVQPKIAETPKPPSIISPLFSLFRWEFIGATVAKFISDVLQYVNPLLLGALITFVQETEAPNWHGWAIAGAMFITAEVRSILLNTYFNMTNRLSAQVQSLLTVIVYEKALKLSNAARQKRTVGEIVNLMAIDINRFQIITPQIQQYWSAPFNMALALLILFQTVGLAALGGVVVLLLLVPCNWIVIIQNKKWQSEQMRLKDERLKLTNEVLSGIRVVKMYAWEEAMREEIETIRQREVLLIRRASLTRSVVDILNVASPFLVSLVAFSFFTLTSPENILTPQIAFISLTVFSQLRYPLFVIAELIGQTVQLIVSNRRLKEFLVANELDPGAVQRDSRTEFDNAVDVEMATFAYEREAPRPTLRSLHVGIPRGQLVAVIGEVGAGKSSLLAALLGEMEKIHGFAAVHGRIAYVPQQAWIQNLTVKANILFGRPFDPILYHRVIEACALSKDFEFLPDGDETEIGEKGINLSGGQKARVSLARALYRQPDILLLDDPLSAVDQIVGKTIFEKAIGPNSLSKNATRILVTHSQLPLPHTDQIVVLRGGEIARIGTHDQLLEDAEFRPFITSLAKKEDSGSSTESNGAAAGDEMEEDGNESDRSEHSSPPVSVRSRKKSRMSSRSSVAKVSSPTTMGKAIQSAKKSPEKPKDPMKLVLEEKAETGRVSNSIYLYYFKAMGLWLYIGFACFMVLNSAFQITRSFWLSTWSDNAADDTVPLRERLGIFAGLGFSEVIFMYCATVLLIFATQNSSNNLHSPLLHRMLRAPIVFFDVTPLGRILNRFGKEMDTIDTQLAGSFRFLWICILSVLSTVTVITLSTPIFIIIAIPLAIIYVFILRFFIPTSRQLQRLSSVFRSPLYTMFAEAIQGVSSIRAYGVAMKFRNDFCNALDVYIQCRYHSLVSARWLAMRLETLGNVVILAAAVLAVLAKGWGAVTAGVIGMSVSYSLSMTNMLSMLVRSLSDVETNIVAVERVKEYSDVEQEAEWLRPLGSSVILPAEWPRGGAVSFKNYATRYRPELELSLMDLNAEIRPGEKIGVVGRTGAGKSSLALALFRLIEPARGRITVDGVNLSQLGLHEIRSRFTIIPQDPTLFSGTLRSNLDPFGRYSDKDLWTAIEEAHLKDFISTLPLGLSHVVSEGGENISVGQRQLLCLARAILRRSRLIVLDEATASVDVQTDQLIQTTIHEKFANSTVITIAHRIQTIMDYDRIMVLQHGRLVEFDTPQRLLNNPRSLFQSLASHH